jgi:hypothetical protein
MDMVTAWLMPAATLNGDDGEVLVPAGNPESVIVTEPVNPLSPVIDTVKAEVEPPVPSVIADGNSTRLKFCGAITVKARLADFVSATDAPVAVTVKLPAGTVAGMDKVTVWLPPAAKLNGEAGEVVAAGGNPESVIETEPANPF